MTRAEFLNNLYRRLGALEQEQAEQYLTYYAEMLMDRMEEGMSEAEAVASMEDVETIAQRILQDEGRADPAPQAPRFPDMPKGEAGQFTHVPQRNRRDWRQPAKIALWALAAIVAVSTVGGRLFNRSETTYAEAVDTSVVQETAPPATVDEVVIGSVRISPKGIEGDTFSITDEGIAIGDALYIGPDGIVMGGTVDLASWGTVNDTWEVPEGGADSVYVDWTGGGVNVCGWDGDTIRFQEYSKSPLNEGQKLGQEINGNTLTIENGSGSSRLLLMVPRNLELTSLNIDTSSSPVSVQGVETAVLYVDTTSGNVSVAGTQAETLSISTSSGDVSLTGVTAGSAYVETSSGQVTGSVSAPNVSVDTSSGDVSLQAMETSELFVNTTSGDVRLAPPELLAYLGVETSSGDVVLDWPEETGFLLYYNTSSGTLSAGGMALARTVSGGYYTWGDGRCQISVDTTSGNLSFT